jgi:4-amino-4-deoxy-L-arabinose transferase-like glycosyltransferase
MVTLVAGAALLCGLLLATSYPLLDRDEGRNSEIAREMAVSGSLLVPTLAGMPYLDKPPAFFWAGAFAVRLFGATAWATRLPSAIAGALTAWLLGMCALRHLPKRTTIVALVLLATAPLYAVLSSYVIFDMPLALCVTALWLLIVEEIERGPGNLRRMAMFAALTVGVLIKGPVMLAWGVGGSLGAALLLRDRTALRWIAWPWGWLLFLGVAGGWFAAASVRYPEYPHYAFLEESMERMASSSFHREQPMWFVPLVLVLGALPWALATPWVTRMSRMSRVGLGFVLFALVFFTVSRSKLATYLLPCFPPMALAAAESWTARTTSRYKPWQAALLYFVLTAILALVATEWIVLPAKPPLQSLYEPAGRLAIVFAVLTGISILGVVLSRAELTLATFLAFTPLTLVIAGPALLAYANAQSGEPLGRALAASALGGSVRFEHCYSPGAQFVLGRAVDIVSDRGAEMTSTYQFRYRNVLLTRGQWLLRSEIPSPDSAVVIVRPAITAGDAPPPGSHAIFRDSRFVAYSRRP